MQNTEYFSKLTEEDQQSVMISIDELCRDNPGIVEQLMKLAQLKINKPFTFKLAIKKLG